MRTFTNTQDFANWLKTITNDTTKNSIPEIAEKVYKDSRKYTYIDTKAMYDSGQLNSDFDKGYVIERAPQVKWLYYTSWIKAGQGNRQAIPQWFEATKKENMNSYKNIIIKKFNERKVK